MSLTCIECPYVVDVMPSRIVLVYLDGAVSDFNPIDVMGVERPVGALTQQNPFEKNTATIFNVNNPGTVLSYDEIRDVPPPNLPISIQSSCTR